MPFLISYVPVTTVLVIASPSHLFACNGLQKLFNTPPPPLSVVLGSSVVDVFTRLSLCVVCASVVSSVVVGRVHDTVSRT